MNLSDEENDKIQSVPYSEIVLGCFIILFSLLLSLNILIIKFQTEEEAELKDINGILKYFSVFCEDLSLNPNDDYETFDVRQKDYQYSLYNNRNVCSSRNLTKITKRTVERQARLRLSKGRDPKPFLQCGNEKLREKSDHQIATFRRISRHQILVEKERDGIIQWQKDTANTFVSKELHYHNGELKVPEASVYYVYTSVLINGSCADSRRINVCKYYVRICARGRWSERILIQKMVVYNSTHEDFVTTLHVGSHFLLRRNETVYVKVSEASRLLHQSAGNVFGIIPVH